MSIFDIPAVEVEDTVCTIMVKLILDYQQQWDLSTDIRSNPESIETRIIRSTVRHNVLLTCRTLGTID